MSTAGGASSTSSSSSFSSSAAAPPPPPPARCKERREKTELRRRTKTTYLRVKLTSSAAASAPTSSELGQQALASGEDLAQILALELGDELVELSGVGLDAHGGQRLRDVVGGGTVVPADDKHEVRGHMLHSIDGVDEWQQVCA